MLPVLLQTLREAFADFPVPDPGHVARLRERLAADGRVRAGRRLALFAVDTGCCGACAASLEELRATRLGAGRAGLVFVETPTDADVLLIIGVAPRTMARPLVRAWAAMGPARIAVFVGDCAATGHLPGGGGASYALDEGGPGRLVPVDLAIRGDPPPPGTILLGLLTLLAAATEPLRPPQPPRRRSSRSVMQ